MISGAAHRTRHLPFVAIALLGLTLEPRLAAAAPSVDADALQAEARQLESEGQFSLAAERWEAVTRSTLDPMALLFADSAWSRAFAADGDVAHLCAGVELSRWLLEQPGLDTTAREEIAEIHAAQLEAATSAGDCASLERRRDVPLLMDPVQRSSAPPPRPIPHESNDNYNAAGADHAEPQGATGRPLRIAGSTALIAGSLLGSASIVAGVETLRASNEFAHAHDRHVAAGTRPSDAEYASNQELYERGRVAQTIAIATGASATVALSVGVALLVRGRRLRDRRLSVTPSAGPRTAGLTLGGRF